MDTAGLTAIGISILFAIVCVGVGCYNKGITAGMKIQLEKLGKQELLHTLTILIPKKDLSEIHLGYYREDEEVRIRVHRADRITMERSEMSTRTLGVAALTGDK